MHSLFRSKDFELSLPGKWVLAGEHRVMRGGKAICFPCPDFKISGKYQAFDPTGKPQKKGLELIFESSCPDFKKEELIEGWNVVLKKLSELLDFDRVQLTGSVHINFGLPPGGGLGASAAFCIWILSWICFEFELNFGSEKMFKLALELENIFHGKSSGMDIAAIMAQKPIIYQKDKGAIYFLSHRSAQDFLDPFKTLGLQVKLHDTGLRAATKGCVDKVILQKQENPTLFYKIDQKMEDSVQLAENALIHSDTDGLILAIKQAHSCFEDWGLVPESIQKQVDELYRKGAACVKLTGSGSGGFLVALWPKKL